MRARTRIHHRKTRPLPPFKRTSGAGGGSARGTCARIFHPLSAVVRRPAVREQARARMQDTEGGVLWTRPPNAVQPVVLGHLTVTVHRCVGLGDASEELSPHVQVSTPTPPIHTQRRLPTQWLTCATGRGGGGGALPAGAAAQCEEEGKQTRRATLLCGECCSQRSCSLL